MERAQKKVWVDNLHAEVKDAQLLLVVHYKGLTVAEISGLRAKVREAGASFKVTKNLLAKRALEDTPYAKLADHMTGPTAIAWGDDPVAGAKVLADFAKNNEKLVLIGGAFGEHVLDAEGIKQLAKMPSLDELRAKIIALINTPATRIAGVLQAPAGQLARVFGAYAKTGD